MNLVKRALTNTIINSHFLPLKFRLKAYRLVGIKLKNCEIAPGCFFNSEHVEIGENSFVNFFTQFHSGYDEKAMIKIGKRCFIGMNVNFCTISHEMGDEWKRAGKNIRREIKVGDGTWIGANSIILPNVTIGNGCIIAAGSVVIKDCEPNSLYAGNPAKKIKDLP